MVRMSTVVSCLCMLVVCGVALGQQGTPVPHKADPRKPAAPVVQPGKDAGGFIDAYKRAGSPRVLVYVDLVGVSAKTVSAGGAVTRLAEQLEAALRDPEVRMLSADAVGAMSEQQLETLRGSGSATAARMVGKAAGADVVLYARVVEQAGGACTGTSVLVDLRRGSTLGTYAWDMVPGEQGLSEAKVAESAAAVAAKVREQFMVAVPAGGNMASAHKVMVRVVGAYQPEELSALREALNAARGVSPASVQVKAEEEGQGAAAGGRVATLELGAMVDLPAARRLVRRAVVDQMGMSAGLIDAREGSVGIKLTPLAVSARERLLVGGAKTTRNASERDRLTLAYANAKRPGVAVLMSLESEEGRVVVGPRVAAGPGVSGTVLEQLLERSDRRKAEFDPRLLEDVVNERLLELGLRVVDVTDAQAEVVKKPENKDRAWAEGDLALAVARAAGAGVVVSGKTRVVTEGEKQRVVVSARALDVATGDVVVTAESEREVAAGAEGLAQAVEELSAEVTGKVAAGLVDRWEGARR